jgi:hypothetical protein
MAGPTGCGRQVGGAPGRVGIVAGLRGRYRGLGNGLGFGWLGSIGLSVRARFDRIFKRKTGFVTLDRLLAQLNANKPELLMVLDRPEIPLHTNGSENDIRCQITRRKVSGGTRSDRGRDCRDTFLALAKTCAKLGISFWAYFGARLAVRRRLRGRASGRLPPLNCARLSCFAALLRAAPPARAAGCSQACGTALRAEMQGGMLEANL